MTFQKMQPEDIRAHKGVSFPGVTTSFFCHDGNGKLFFAKRSKKARDEHGRWDCGGGGLKHGSTLLKNVEREIKEEYDVTPKRIDFIGYRDAFRTQNGYDTHWVSMDFVVLVDPADVKINEPDMFDDSGWFDLDNLPSPLHSQFNLFLKQHGDTLRYFMKTQKA